MELLVGISGGADRWPAEDDADDDYDQLICLLISLAGTYYPKLAGIRQTHVLRDPGIVRTT